MQNHAAKVKMKKKIQHFWTQFKIVHFQGPCSLRPCTLRPYCSIFNEPDIETLIKLGVRESLVVLHLAAELSLNPVCKLSSTAPKASSSSLETEWVYWVLGWTWS